MPNTQSAERRTRNSARKHQRNASVKSRLKTLEKWYVELVAAGKKDEATVAFREVSSAFDKAANAGVVHVNNASRKKSRLSARLATLK